ncbi:class I SAM-dependent methyltransferase [Sciscionella marina]|uniref:class I SAM-dependent methyltransferase n=1 Tax=Sciscionella marina TaxID=508770 RepID=UPI00058BC28E|nr:class I SAM-dependent methyltransferase [Sciscionella marina]
MTASTVTSKSLHGIMRGYVQTSLLRTAFDMGVFDAIHRGANSPSQIAVEIDADPRGTRILLDALVAIDLLESNSGGFLLPEGGERYLVSSGEQYFGSAMKIGVSRWEWEAQWRLAEAVRNGGTVMNENALSPDFSYWEDFAAHMNWFQNGAATLMAEELVPWAVKQDSARVLDVACSHGSYGFFFAQREPKARITGLDWPHVLKYTKQNAEHLGLLDRWTPLAGDMFEVALGGPYDIAMVTNVLHHFAEHEAIKLLQRVAEAVRPGGRIAISGHTRTRDDTPKTNPGSYLFSVIMLTMTVTGETHSIETYERMLDKAGFTDFRVYTNEKAMHTVFTAERA